MIFLTMIVKCQPQHGSNICSTNTNKIYQRIFFPIYDRQINDEYDFITEKNQFQFYMIELYGAVRSYVNFIESAIIIIIRQKRCLPVIFHFCLLLLCNTQGVSRCTNAHNFVQLFLCLDNTPLPYFYLEPEQLHL